MDKNNIKNLIKRIGSEAETVEDMEQLLLSELDAYEKFEKNHSGTIKLWPKSKLSKHATVSLIGDLEGYPIGIIQTMKNNILKSEYQTVISL